MSDDLTPEELDAVHEFFEQSDEPESSADTLAAGEEAIEEALGEPESSAATEEDESPSEGPEDADEASEEVEEEPEQEPEEQEEPAQDQWEKRYKDQQAFHDRQMAAMQQQLDQLNQWAQNVYQQQLQQAQAAQQVPTQQNPLAQLSKEDAVSRVETDLVGTFQQVAQYRPDLVAPVIAKAREAYGNEIGDQMQLEYNQYQITQQNQAYQKRLDEIEQARQLEIEQRDAPQQIQQTMAQLVDDIANQYGDAYKAVEEDFLKRASETAPDFKEYMDSRGLEMSPDAIHYFLTKTFNDIREENLSKQASKPRRARKVTPQDHVETSTNTDGGRDEEMSADDRAMNEILQGAIESGIDVTAPTR